MMWRRALSRQTRARTSLTSGKTTIPEHLEIEYMLDQRRLLHDLGLQAAATAEKLDQRTDSDELLAFLNMTAPQILDTAKLRLRLRRLANRMTDEKLQEMTALLGRQVRRPHAAVLEKWITQQVEAVQFTVEQWLLAATEEVTRSRVHGIPIAELTAALRFKAKQMGMVSEFRASAAVLQLNAQLIEETAKGGGSTHYRWVTQDDGKVRDNHVPLHYTIQSWNKPPPGGGTRPGDNGHPGSGYGCRCLPTPIQGQVALSRAEI
jgi:uncharacterized protein with gpF-like domain